MNFDQSKLSQDLEPRTGEVVCNELKALYEPAPEEDLVITVRGLPGNDLAAVAAMRNTNAFIETLSEALVTKNGKDGAGAIKGLLGLFDDELHPELKYRVEILVRGALEPKIDYPAAVKLARDFYVVLYRLSEKILEVSGLGAQLKKNSNSGLTTTPSS